MPNVAPYPYVRHRPEHTLLYEVIEHHLPEFTDHLLEKDNPSPSFVLREFHEYLRCGRLEHGFVRVKCTDCRNELLVAFSCKRRGFYSGHPALRPAGQPSAVQNRSRRFCAPPAAAAA